MFNGLHLFDWTCEETVFFSFAAAVSLYKYQYFFGCEKEKVVYFLYIERQNAWRIFQRKGESQNENRIQIVKFDFEKVTANTKNLEWSEVNSFFSLWISSIFLGFWNANKICDNNVVFCQEYFLVVLIWLKNFSSKFQDFKIFSIK